MLAGQAVGGAEGDENGTGILFPADRLARHADGQVAVSVAVEVVGQFGPGGDGLAGRDGHQTAGQTSRQGRCHGETD
ncbi:hypothetical protein [Streptomyces olivaceoviridis]|uniref:hypothetical protein n=1 Tax=Streptomyces olivaceoviridis TaxID=1921 RepID=UPI001E556C2F|nr:hypothetical protein [Streptomyces olivaceoviridis]